MCVCFMLQYSTLLYCPHRAPSSLLFALFVCLLSYFIPNVFVPFSPPCDLYFPFSLLILWHSPAPEHLSQCSCCEWNTSTWFCSQGLPRLKGLPADSHWESKGSTSSAVSNFPNVQLWFSEVLSWQILPRSLKWTTFEGDFWPNPLWCRAMKPFGTI